MIVLGWNVDIVSDEHHGPVKRHFHDAVVVPLFCLKALICSCQYLFFSGSIISAMTKKPDTYILKDVGMDTARNILLPDKDGFFNVGRGQYLQQISIKTFNRAERSNFVISID